MKAPKPSAAQRKQQAEEAARAKAENIDAISKNVRTQTSTFSSTFRRKPLFANGFVTSGGSM